MKSEVYFIKYAFPCSHILCDVRGEITNDEFEKMRIAALNDEVLDRKFLEKIFFRAFERIAKLAEEIGKDKWDIEVIREYFRVRHNPILDKSDYPESFKKMCKVHEASVLEDLGDEAIVLYDGGKRRVKKDYLPDIKVGDRVTIHWQYAVEKII